MLYGDNHGWHGFHGYGGSVYDAFPLQFGMLEVQQQPDAADPGQKLRHAHRLEHIIAIARGDPPRPENTGGATTGLPSNSPAPSLCHPIRVISEIRGWPSVLRCPNTP